MVSNHHKNVEYSQTKTLESEEMIRIPEPPEPIEIQKIPVKDYNPLSDIIYDIAGNYTLYFVFNQFYRHVVLKWWILLLLRIRLMQKLLRRIHLEL